MSAALDFRPHAIAIRAAIKAQLPAAINVYDYSTVPGGNGTTGTLPTSFVVVSVERRYNPTLRLSAQSGSTSWRTAAQCVATTVNNVGLLMTAVALALNESPLIVGDDEATTPIQWESESAPSFGNGRYAAESFWTYAL